MQRTRIVIKSVLFCLVLFFATLVVSGVLGIDSSSNNDHIRLFVKEKNRKLDGIYIGASEVHEYWQPLFGWAQHGIAVWNYSVDMLSPWAVKYLLIEAQKTQPDAVYIIDLNDFKGETAKTNNKAAHWLLDYLPWSINKINLLNKLAEESSFSLAEKVELYLPIIRFHSRWDSLGEWVFDASDYDYKSSVYNGGYQKGIYDITEEFEYYSGTSLVPDDVKTALDEVLEYCDEKQLRVFFVKQPQALPEIEQERLNELENYVISRGYTCVDLLENTRILAIDLKQDFYNAHHTNVHGAAKVSAYLGEYLVDNYGLKDKRGQTGWESWDQSAKDYIEFLVPYLLPFEGEANRTNIPAPSLNKLSVSGQQIKVKWKESEDAQGYIIYRKEDSWEYVAETDQLEYVDEGLKPETKYTYTVVPIIYQDGEKCYGHFNVKGVSGTTGGAKE